MGKMPRTVFVELIISQKFDATDFKVKVAGEVRDFDAEKYMTKKDIKRNDPFAVYAMGFAVQAMDDSGIDMEKEDASRVGVIFGSGVGGLGTIVTGYENERKRSFKGFTYVYTYDYRKYGDRKYCYKIWCKRYK